MLSYSLCVRTVGFTGATRDLINCAIFWDRGLYSGNASPLNHDADGDAGWQLGLAEFTSGNFLGQDAIYGEWFTPGTREFALHYFPYPSRNTSTTYFQVRRRITAGDVDTMDYPDGSSGDSVYLRKNADGVKSRFRHSVLPYLVTMRLDSPETIVQSHREGRPHR